MRGLLEAGDDNAVMTRGTATLLAMRTEPARLPHHLIRSGFSETEGWPIGNRGYANLPA